MNEPPRNDQILPYHGPERQKQRKDSPTFLMVIGVLVLVAVPINVLLISGIVGWGRLSTDIAIIGFQILGMGCNILYAFLGRVSDKKGCINTLILFAHLILISMLTLVVIHEWS